MRSSTVCHFDKGKWGAYNCAIYCGQMPWLPDFKLQDDLVICKKITHLNVNQIWFRTGISKYLA